MPELLCALRCRDQAASSRAQADDADALSHPAVSNRHMLRTPTYRAAFHSPQGTPPAAGLPAGDTGGKPDAYRACTIPSCSPSKLYPEVGESRGATPTRAALSRINWRMYSTPELPAWISRATTPATCGAAMLVPDILVVPPPSLVDRMPTEVAKQALLRFSWSSPGAEMVMPIPVVMSNFPSVVK